MRSLFVLCVAITVSPFENSISLSDRSTVRMWTDRCFSVYRNILRYRSRHNISLIYCPYQSVYWYDCFCNENRVKSESFFILPYPFVFAFEITTSVQVVTVVDDRCCPALGTFDTIYFGHSFLLFHHDLSVWSFLR